MDADQMFTDLGRPLYGATPPGGATPCARDTPLTAAEAGEVAAIIAAGRLERRSAELPERLRTRDWPSVEQVMLALDQRLGWAWRGLEDRRGQRGDPPRGRGAESLARDHLPGHHLPQRDVCRRLGLFINYRNCECEFAFQLSLDYPSRTAPYTEADARAGIDALLPALELGDTVFTDWYGASGYFGSSMDNGGRGRPSSREPGSVTGRPPTSAGPGMDVYLNGHYIKSGQARAAIGHPVTSLTWLLNWAREQGPPGPAGDMISTGTCTGHLFAAPWETVRADFGPLGAVEARFA